MIIAQLSDPHLSRSPGSPIFDGESALSRAVEHLRRLPSLPDMIVVTGDLAEHGHQDEYDCVRRLLSALPMPVYVVPGNHDARKALLEAFGVHGTDPLPGFMQYVIEDAPVRLIALDTLVEGEAVGSLGEAQLDWLGTQLTRAPQRPTLVIMHHPPFVTGIDALDQIGLIQAEAFGRLIRLHPQVVGIAAGHVHSPMFRAYQGTVAWTSGSTQHHLSPDLGRTVGWAARTETPSCLLHVWQGHTGLVTHISHIGEDAPIEVFHDGERWLA